MAGKPLVKDYMTEDVHSIPYNITVREVIKEFIKSTHQNLPVTKNGNLVGFINAKDLLRNLDKTDRPVIEITRRKLIVARPELSLDDAARIMFRHGFKKLPVIDDNGKLVGIISNSDILRSHIERATPRKVEMVKDLIESEHGVKVNVKRYLVPIDKLHPTQNKIYADELQGREYELRRGLAEPLIVIKKKNYFVLVDGHHRAIAAKNLEIRELMTHVLEMDKNIELGMEKSARKKGLLGINDIEVMDYAQHPLVEITTKLVKKKDVI
ncbi:MAG TPA: CBS domain-containing protein [Candidatus Altiarchaeales archaeon]|nr:CBS domain-containing protein [Candidatus Altiarchaeales archaeon]